MVRLLKYLSALFPLKLPRHWPSCLPITSVVTFPLFGRVTFFVQ